MLLRNGTSRIFSTASDQGQPHQAMDAALKRGDWLTKKGETGCSIWTSQRLFRWDIFPRMACEVP